MLKLIIILYLLYSLRLCECSHILVVFPVPENRHGVLSDSLVKLLLDDGHKVVTYVTQFPRETRVHNLKYVDISSKDHSDEEDWINTANDTLPMEIFGLQYAQRALKHPNMQELIMNTTISFDLVIAEWYYSGLLAPISALYDCPFIWYSATDVSWKSLSLVNSEVSTFPPSSRGLSIIERVLRMWSQLRVIFWNYYHVASKELPAYEQIFREAFEVRREALPNYETLVYNSSLLFINSHPLLSNIPALPMNAKYIGSHHIEATTPHFPKNLKKLMDESIDGVIYVDLATNLINENIQEDILQQIIEAFGQIKQTVIWKYDEILVNIPKNLYTIKKPPQQSILNHVNTIAFINHGDMLSIIEAAYHGVPVIGIPITEDQISNIDILAQREYGIKVDYNTELSSKVVDAIDTIAEDKSYRVKSREAKEILRNRLTSPQEELQYWVKMIIQTHGATHLRSPTLKISTLERYNLDIALLIMLLFWFLTKVVKVIEVHFCSSNDDLIKKDL
ncbi:UDP-glucosyltransferase 2-like [Melitaea cinxia]|uniref:UDP-glucosyltransferase 2-like n=1 Tax=Melitaea cinxia TaxID=113334 RepID=UPI001E26FBC5|nr:UDP-glucosyltransferase 2-like [Melitaea cinxia]